MQIKKLASSKKILVVGDIILDHYIYGKVHRISPEAPVPVVLKDRSVYCLGGASNVAQNITSFGSECYLIGVTGDDGSSVVLETLMKEKKISPFIIKDVSRTTTEKMRVVGNGHQVTRIDSESTDPISEEIKCKVRDVFKSLIGLSHGVILQDYGKGLLTPDLIKDLIEISKENKKIVLVDPKDKDFSRYSGVTWIKPNLSEFKTCLDIPQTTKLDKKEISNLAGNLINDFGFEGVLVTMSEEGMLVRTPDSYESVDGDKIEVTDVSGAGDTVSAVFLLMQLAGLSLKDSLALANLSGSMVCQVSGAVSVDADSLFELALSRGLL